MDKYAGNVPEIRQSYYNFHPYQPDNTLEWYSFGGRANWGLTTAAAGIENFAGQARVTTTGSSIKLYLPNSNGNVFIRNAYAKTTAISKIGGMLGKFSFGLGVAMDVKGMQVYKNNPKSPNAVQPAKAGINTVVGAVGTWGGFAGAIYSIFYFGIDAFYPNGWNGVHNDIEAAETKGNYHMDWGTMAPNGA
ncbi:hypothetical protein [Chryseobacterium candidae]|uniref:Uncharacterized protein n=1 Tax=Chryseobacterium candidae TaxID=1978493 RepID=A0ABY2RBE9_9FLAO|nr:hypothetical protein [Chryseobacterium candidae]THV62931.1 hypothetical protein EK417_03455 [Chryseobacterium candidae]